MVFQYYILYIDDETKTMAFNLLPCEPFDAEGNPDNTGADG